MRKLSLCALVLLLSATLAGSSQESAQANLLGTSAIESYLEALRLQAGIPGMSAAIVQDGEIVWERGLGFQDQEARLRAEPGTPYAVGDLTQTVAAVLALQCVEQRRLSLDQPASAHGIGLPEADASVRHLLGHTSEGTPGDTYRYDLHRFALVSTAIELCVPGEPFRRILAGRLLDRLAMIDSVPGRDLLEPSSLPPDLFSGPAFERYASVLRRLAVPYRVDKRGRATPSDLDSSDGITAASGLVSTVRDLARFDAALDAGELLLEESRAEAWTNGTSRGRLPHPTGLGWFVQTYRGERVVWHFGLIPNGYSSLIVKVPDRGLTLILLANTDGLSAPYQLHLGDITRSPFALAFLRLFV